MMEGCEQCLVSAEGQQRQYSTILETAKKDAKSTKKDMAIYKEGHEYFYCEAQKAFEAGYPIQEVVSQYS